MNEIYKIQKRGPYYIGGYSFGGCVAYEMSQIILNQTQEISHILMLDTCVNAFENKGEFKAAEYCADEVINYNINKNVEHFSKLTDEYIYKENENRILFLKNRKNTGTLANLCKNYSEDVLKGKHATFLSADVEKLAGIINKFTGY